ncbi:hypothetical protein [Methylobacterium nodulans]|uniref:hypothetical protein n=1 Tax=Methylobacterium nodulans TaxID=114616 RepID=UPI0012EE72C3|nr:hypothetical protein [Methylobacterium nodulans]
MSGSYQRHKSMFNSFGFGHYAPSPVLSGGLGIIFFAIAGVIYYRTGEILTWLILCGVIFTACSELVSATYSTHRSIVLSYYALNDIIAEQEQLSERILRVQSAIEKLQPRTKSGPNLWGDDEDPDPDL